MKALVAKIISNCEVCQLNKLTRMKTKQPMVLTDTPGCAFEKVALDIVGSLPETDDGNIYILTMQCLLTKYIVAAPLKNLYHISFIFSANNNTINKTFNIIPHSIMTPNINR